MRRRVGEREWIGKRLREREWFWLREWVREREWLRLREWLREREWFWFRLWLRIGMRERIGQWVRRRVRLVVAFRDQSASHAPIEGVDVRQLAPTLGAAGGSSCVFVGLSR